MTETAVVDTFKRYYKIVEPPYDEPAPRDDMTVRRLCAAEAELALRERLAIGHVPTAVMLVSPEVGDIADVNATGEVGDCYAWRNPADDNEIIARHGGGGMYVLADLVDVVDPIADPHRLFAEAGSIIALTARIARLTVAPWLAPVAGLLERTYGVPVVVGGDAGVRDVLIRPAPPLVVPAAIGPELLALVHRQIAHDANWAYATHRSVDRGYAIVEDSAPPAALTADLCFIIAKHCGYELGVPVTSMNALGLLRYPPNSRHGVHTDRYPQDPFVYNRTCSYSLLLSEPGVDFTGGGFCTDEGPIELHAGDLVGFTAETRHEVRPVESGHRLVLVCFATWDGWRAPAALAPAEEEDAA